MPAAHRRRLVDLTMDRWLGGEGERLAAEVVARLRSGGRLEDLGLGEHQGRVDLRGLRAPLPRRVRRYELDGWFVEELGRLVELERCRLEFLDLSGTQLEILRFFHVQIDDCRFDRARCQDWRMWAVDVTNTSFEGADLRSSALGAWYQGRGNQLRSSRALETVRAGVPGSDLAGRAIDPGSDGGQYGNVGSWSV